LQKQLTRGNVVKINTFLPTPQSPVFKPEIPPASLGLGATSKNRRKSHSWIDRHPVWSTIMIFGTIGAIVWWADCRINPEAHSQSLLQGLHQLFH
jgi:hypothetical protein